MSDQVLVRVDEEGADPERVDAVTRLLRAELLQLEVDDVVALRDGPAPDGARATDALAVGGLLVAIGNSQAVRSVVAAVRSWLTRTPAGGRKVRLEVGGDVLELSGATSDEQERLVQLFLDRHAPDAGP